MLYIKSNLLPINNFTIYAERHCGTNFLEEYISSSFLFENSPLPVIWDYGHKHWFGFDNDIISSIGQKTLFIGIIRDPYNWLISMKRMPHHLRNWNGKMHENPFVDIHDFLTSEIESYHHGTEILKDHHIYEHRRYKNIFELREVKNNYLINTMPTIAENYILINYELLHSNIYKFIETVNNNFSISFNKFIPNDISKRDYGINQDYLGLINDNLCWETENKLGYKKRICGNRLKCCY